MGLSAANRLYLGDDSWEYSAWALYLCSWFNYVFYGCDSDALAWTSYVNFHRLDVLVLENQCLYGLFVHEQNAVFDLRLI